MKIEPLSPVLGATITGIDIRRLSAADVEELLPHLHEHGVLSFPEQQLDPADLVNFTAQLGEPQRHLLEQFCLPEQPDVYVISNIVENGRPLGNPREGFAWHTDLSYRRHPSAYTLLYALEVPSVGGDTLFSNLYAAYDALPTERRYSLDGLHSIRNYAKLYGDRPGVEPLAPAQRRRIEEVTHPIVRRHPATGRPGLYLGTDDVTGVVGMTEPAGTELMAELVSHCLRDQFCYAYRWRPGDLLVWDNSGLLHTATDYDRKRERRLIYRTSVKGTVPQ